MQEKKQMQAIIGGIFGTGTYTVWDEEGQAHIKKEKFNIRLYKDLWYSGAIKKLRGNRLGVFLTIAIHADNQGEGWPTQNTIASMLGIGRDAVINALKHLEKDGFIEREKTRHKGQFDNTVYKIKFAPDLSKNDIPPKNKRKKSDRPQNDHVWKSNMVENPENQHFNHVGKTDTEKPTRKNRHGKTDTKDDLIIKNDSFIKDDPSINHHLAKSADKEKQPASKQKHDDDDQYRKLRNLFVKAEAPDIKNHEIHYPRFKNIIKKQTSFDKLILAANQYIAQAKEDSEIVWFLGGGYRNYLAKPKPSNQRPNSGLPAAVEAAYKEQEVTITDESNQEWEEKKKNIQKKLAEWEAKKQAHMAKLGIRIPQISM